MFSWLGSSHCVFPSVLPDYKPPLPASVGWETFPFQHCSKLGLGKRNSVSSTCICDKVVLAGSAGVLLCPLTGWMHRAARQSDRAWGARSALSQTLWRDKARGAEKELNEDPQGLGICSCERCWVKTGPAQVLGCLGYLPVQFSYRKVGSPWCEGAFVDIFSPFLKILFIFSLKPWIFILLHEILGFWGAWASVCLWTSTGIGSAMPSSGAWPLDV